MFDPVGGDDPSEPDREDATDEGRARRSRGTTRRTFLGGLVGAGTVGFASRTRAIDGEGVPVPSEPDDYTYPTMGANDDAPTAQILGNFKCPYTREFVRNDLPSVVEEYVEPGRLQLQFRQLAYEPYPNDYSHGDPDFFISNSDARIGAAALGVWNADPEGYWAFLDGLFESPVSGWVTYDDLRERMRWTGVSDRSAAISLAESGRFASTLHRTTETFVAEGAQHTPRLRLGGEITNPRWGLDDWLDARLDTTRGAADESGSDGGGRSAPTRELSVLGNGRPTTYRIRVSGGIESTSNVENGDSAGGSTATGTVTWRSDNYRFSGDVLGVELVDGADDLAVWVDGRKRRASGL